MESERWEALEPTLPLVYVAEYSHEGAIRYISEVVRDWTGRDPQEFVENPALWYEFVHPDDRARVHELEEYFFESREQLDLEYRMVGPDGEARWVWERNTIVRDLKGDPICTHGTVVDLNISISRSPAPSAAAKSWRCSTSTSTDSAASTTPSVMHPATWC